MFCSWLIMNLERRIRWWRRPRSRPTRWAVWLHKLPNNSTGPSYPLSVVLCSHNISINLLCSPHLSSLIFVWFSTVVKWYPWTPDCYLSRKKLIGEKMWSALRCHQLQISSTSDTTTYCLIIAFSYSTTLVPDRKYESNHDMFIVFSVLKW
jgi:hypothetical protein